MKRHSVLATLTLSAAWVLSLGDAHAQQSEVIRHYRFLPRHSTLTQSRPWLEAPDIQLRVFGTFDIVFQRIEDDSWGQSAQFENVKAWAYNPFTAAAPLGLDSVLNLSGLKGRQLPVLAPFDVFKFEGKTSDGSAVDLFADVIGPWLYLNGGTTPPQDDKHHVVYELRSQARERPFADFNDDGSVDGADLTTWVSDSGATMSGAVDTTHFGDADGDQMVDGADFLTWQRQLGVTAPTAHAVPEPAAMSLIAAALLLLRLRPARRRRAV
jgi:hypothetical protein